MQSAEKQVIDADSQQHTARESTITAGSLPFFYIEDGAQAHVATASSGEECQLIDMNEDPQTPRGQDIPKVGRQDAPPPPCKSGKPRPTELGPGAPVRRLNFDTHPLLSSAAASQQ